METDRQQGVGWQAVSLLLFACPHWQLLEEKRWTGGGGEEDRVEWGGGSGEDGEDGVEWG